MLWSGVMMWLVALSFCSHTVTSMTALDSEFVLALLERLKIEQSVMVTDAMDAHVFQVVRYISSHFMMAAFLRTSSLRAFITHTQPAYKTMVVLTAEEQLQFIFQERHFNELREFSWLGFDIPRSVIPTLHIPYDCHFHYVTKEDDTQYTVEEAYQIKDDQEVIVQKYGSWSPNTGMRAVSHTFYQRRLDLQGTEFIITTADQYRPYCGFTVELRHKELWLEYSRILNFTILWTTVPMERVSEYGRSPDGSTCWIAYYSGGLSQDIIAPTFALMAHMYIQQNDDFGSGLNAVARPFQTRVWGTIVFWLILATAALSVVMYTLVKPRNVLFSYLNAWLMILFLLSSQDGRVLTAHEAVERVPVRAFNILTRCLSAILVPAYSAGVIALLTVVIPETPFTDLEGLVQNGEYYISTMKYTTVYAMIKYGDSKVLDVIRKLYTVPEREFASSMADGVASICSDPHIVFVGYGRYIDRTPTTCKIHRLPGKISEGLCGVQLSNNSQFAEVLNILTKSFYGPGIINRMDPKAKNEVSDLGVNIEEEVSVSLEEVYAAVMLVPAAAVIALCVLLGEILVRQCRRSTQVKPLKVVKSVYSKDTKLKLNKIKPLDIQVQWPEFQGYQPNRRKALKRATGAVQVDLFRMEYK